MRVFSAGHVARREQFGSRARHHRSCISTCGNGIARRQRVTAASLAPAALLAPIGGAPARPARAFDAVPSPSQAELASFWTAPDVTAPLNAFYDRIGKALPRAMRTVPSDAEFPVDASVPLAAAGFAASIERCIVPPEVLGRCLDAFQRHISIDAPLVACAADGVRANTHDLDAEYSVFPVELLLLVLRMCPPQVDAYSALGVIVRDPVVLAVQWDAMVVRLRLAWAAQGVVVGNVPWNCRGCVKGPSNTPRRSPDSTPTSSATRASAPRRTWRTSARSCPQCSPLSKSRLHTSPACRTRREGLLHAVPTAARTFRQSVSTSRRSSGCVGRLLCPPVYGEPSSEGDGRRGRAARRGLGVSPPSAVE